LVEIRVIIPPFVDAGASKDSTRSRISLASGYSRWFMVAFMHGRQGEKEEELNNNGMELVVTVSSDPHFAMCIVYLR